MIFLGLILIFSFIIGTLLCIIYIEPNYEMITAAYKELINSENITKYIQQTLSYLETQKNDFLSYLETQKNDFLSYLEKQKIDSITTILYNHFGIIVLGLACIVFPLVAYVITRFVYWFFSFICRKSYKNNESPIKYNKHGKYSRLLVLLIYMFALGYMYRNIEFEYIMVLFNVDLLGLINLIRFYKKGNDDNFITKFLIEKIAKYKENPYSFISDRVSTFIIAKYVLIIYLFVMLMYHPEYKHDYLTIISLLSTYWIFFSTKIETLTIELLSSIKDSITGSESLKSMSLSLTASDFFVEEHKTQIRNMIKEKTRLPEVDNLFNWSEETYRTIAYALGMPMREKFFALGGETFRMINIDSIMYAVPRVEGTYTMFRYLGEHNTMADVYEYLTPMQAQFVCLVRYNYKAKFDIFYAIKVVEGFKNNDLLYLEGWAKEPDNIRYNPILKAHQHRWLKIRDINNKCHNLDVKTARPNVTRQSEFLGGLSNVKIVARQSHESGIVTKSVNRDILNRRFRTVSIPSSHNRTMIRNS
jgi:hypothetical protein